MYTKEALLDMHSLTHRGTGVLLEHCAGLSADQLHHELPGFGYATVQRQLHHILEAEQYWVNVLTNRYQDSDLAAATEDIAWKGYPGIADIEQYARKVAAATVDYLQAISNEALNAPKEFLTWPQTKRTLVPARVILRTLTHAFHHRGQAAAMCRLLGHPVPPMDFPVAPDEPNRE